MDIKKIIFWEPTLSIHKTGLLEALVHNYPDVKFVYVSDSGVSRDRELQGWAISAPEILDVIVSPSNSDIEKIVIEGRATTLHIFSGIRHYNVIVNALRFVKSYNAMFAIYSEPRVIDGFKGKIRLIQSIIEERWIRNNVKLILAIGKHGPDWFSLAGYAREKIYPFAYFIKPSSNLHINKINTYNKINIGFVGRLCKEKGFNHFLKAIAKLDPEKYCATIIGSGSLEYLINDFLRFNKIQVSYIKCVPNDKIYENFSKMDLLILPSITKDDGWGAVISEALLCGAGVIVSNYVGSSILVDNKLIGFRLDVVDAGSIAKKIQSIDSDSFYSNESRKYRHQWAKNRLTADAGAKHLMSIINYSFNGGERPNYFYS